MFRAPQRAGLALGQSVAQHVGHQATNRPLLAGSKQGGDHCPADRAVILRGYCAQAADKSFAGEVAVVLENPQVSIGQAASAGSASRPGAEALTKTSENCASSDRFSCLSPNMSTSQLSCAVCTDGEYAVQVNDHSRTQSDAAHRSQRRYRRE